MQKYEKEAVSVNGKRFTALIADSTIKKMIGLMFRSTLDSNTCMLFIFGGEGFPPIWMRNMSFPIDVIWVNEKLKVVDMVENMVPCTSLLGCKEYYPTQKAKYVLEFTKGTIKRIRIKKGSRISFIS